MGLRTGLMLEDRVGVKLEVRVGSILFICTTVIENLNRKWLPCGILALCCNFLIKYRRFTKSINLKIPARFTIKTIKLNVKIHESAKVCYIAVTIHMDGRMHR